MHSCILLYGQLHSCMQTYHCLTICHFGFMCDRVQLGLASTYTPDICHPIQIYSAVLLYLYQNTLAHQFR